MIIMDLISVLFGMIGPHLRKTLGVIASTRLGARGIWPVRRKQVEAVFLGGLMQFGFAALSGRKCGAPGRIPAGESDGAGFMWQK